MQRGKGAGEAREARAAAVAMWAAHSCPDAGVLRAACCVLRAACCVLRAACCVLRGAWGEHELRGASAWWVGASHLGAGRSEHRVRQRIEVLAARKLARREQRARPRGYRDRWWGAAAQVPLSGIEHGGDHALRRCYLTDDLVQQQVDAPRQRQVGRVALNDGDPRLQPLRSHGLPGRCSGIGIGLDGKHVLGTRAGSDDGQQRERAGANIEAQLAWRVPLDGAQVRPCPHFIVTHRGIRLVGVSFAQRLWR